MSSPIIIAEELARHFEKRVLRKGALGALRSLAGRGERELFRAVDDISFSIGRGEIVGYVGPNGAGKSTTIKMLTGILVPTSGRAEVSGMIPWERRKQLAQRIGVVFGQRSQLWWDLALIESLELLQHLYRVPRDRFRENLLTATELLGLDEFLTTPVRQLSLGQRMRGDLAAALLHDPAILYLDEPTIGLDIVAKQRIREFLLAMNRERGVTMLLTTHDLQDIEQLCQRIMVINHGRLVFDGDLHRLTRSFGARRRLIVDFAERPAPGMTRVNDDRLQVVRVDGPRVVVAFDQEAMPAPAVLNLVAGYGRVIDMAIEEPEIESVIRAMYDLPGELV